MKKTNYLIGAAAMILASCANDELVRPVDPSPSGQEAPMTFNIKRANQSRADGLETKQYDFGVWAYKTHNPDGGTGATEDNKQIVMDNYLVGFHGNVDAAAADPKPNLGYTSAAKTEQEGSWFYAGLGNEDQAEYVSEAGVAAVPANKSVNTHQYLKYWDDSYDKTYFYAYTPYKTGVTIAQDASNKKVTMTFPGGGTDWMYASAMAVNSAHANVPLVFKSINSKLNIAFYNTIPGYDVEIINYSESKPGLGFVPSVQTVNAGYASYAPHAINTPNPSGAAKVEYTIDASTGAISETVTQDSPTTSAYGFTWAVQTGNISTASAAPTTYDYQGILPQECACGFTLNVSFKLIAKDTKEEIYVRGARVYVPEAYFNWATNHVYTYKFKITGNVPGTTGAFDETSFSPVPNPLHALYPIVFEDVTVKDMETTTVETIVNALTIDPTALSVAMGTPGTININLSEEVADGTLSVASSNTAVATVVLTGKTVTVTPVATGTATVTITLTKDSKNYYANCAVIVKGVTLDKTIATLTVGGTTETLTASLYGIAGTVTWTSSETGVATVADGVVTGVTAGTATITASITTADDKTYTATCVVTVS